MPEPVQCRTCGLLAIPSDTTEPTEVKESIRKQWSLPVTDISQIKGYRGAPVCVADKIDIPEKCGFEKEHGQFTNLKDSKKIKEVIEEWRPCEFYHKHESGLSPKEHVLLRVKKHEETTDGKGEVKTHLYKELISYALMPTIVAILGKIKEWDTWVIVLLVVITLAVVFAIKNKLYRSFWPSR